MDVIVGFVFPGAGDVEFEIFEVDGHGGNF